jgi:cytochrome c oxidase subunit 2
VRKLWFLFFMIWPILAIVSFWISPAMNWWFPYGNESATPLGVRIDSLFYLILIIVGVAFVGTQLVLGYVLWRGSVDTEGKALFTHGNHNLEVIWTIVPSAILLFISLYQLEVWAEYRVTSKFPEEAQVTPIAEVTARQFEWRIRYPDPGRELSSEELVEDWLRNPKPDDLYTVNDLHVPSNRPVQIRLRSDDVQHSFFVPELRVKQDAVPGLVIPIWFEIHNTKEQDPKLKGVTYELLCAELCGWGHYKMKARVVAQPEKSFHEYLEQLKKEQFYDGVSESSEASVAKN